MRNVTSIKEYDDLINYDMGIVELKYVLGEDILLENKLWYLFNINWMLW